MSPVEMQFSLDLNYFKITDLIVFSEIEKRPSGNYKLMLLPFLF
jgi:hypothetical protein